MGQKNVTLSLDEDTYEKYKEFCKKNAVALSRSIEVFMEDKTKKGEKMSQALLSLGQASQWASDYLDRPVTTSNISYLIQYAKIKKYLDGGKKIKLNLIRTAFLVRRFLFCQPFLL